MIFQAIYKWSLLVFSAFVVGYFFLNPKDVDTLVWVVCAAALFWVIDAMFNPMNMEPF